MAGPSSKAPPAPPAPAPAPAQPPTPEGPPVAAAVLDARDARLLVQAASVAVEAIVSIRSRLSAERDATPATGQLLEAVLAGGGTLRDYDRPKIWALRHALGGESSSLRSSESAASAILFVLLEGMRPPADADHVRRIATSNEEIGQIARLLKLCDHSIAATKEIESWESGRVLAQATVNRLAHEARLAAAGPKAPPPPPRAARSAASPPSPKTGGPEGDYVIEGSVDSPGGNPFPTTPTVG